MVATASSPAGQRGFTLLEVLITIALIALLTGVLVIGTNRLLRERPKSSDELFWAAVAAVRQDALLNNHDVRLTFDARESEFVAVSDLGEIRLPFVSKEIAELDFLAPRSAGMSAVLIGGQMVETLTIPAVTFYGDGTCSPFRAQLKTRNGVRVLEIDPWTCAPMLAAAPR